MPKHQFFAKRLRRRGSVIILFTLMLPVIMMAVGLAIDRTMVFIVEAKLGAAVDGAALGAGRLLGTNADTEEIAGEFLTANFTTGYWGSMNLVPHIHATDNLALHTITVTASVDVPLLFMRVLGSPVFTVYASAQATRRDSRIVMVLDRSGSMSGQIANLRTGAATLTTMFTPGTDQLGLVVYGTSALVAYPSARPYSRTGAAGAYGPDTGFLTTQTSGPMLTMITAMASINSNTGMAEGLALAYIELQKAHAREIAVNGADGRLNAIVLFTDGIANTISVYANDPANNSLKTTSSCTNNPATATASTQMYGAIGAVKIDATHDNAYGMFRLASLYSGTALYWVQNPNDDVLGIGPGGPIANCVYLKDAGITAGNTTDLKDLKQIPPYDIYGTSTSGTAYTHSAKVYDGTAYNNTQPTSGYHLRLASWNAVDNVAETIRNQTGSVSAMNAITIYTIAYTGSQGGVDDVLLKRLANTQDALGYDPLQQTGSYIPVSLGTDLTSAFANVGSAILRLAK